MSTAPRARCPQQASGLFFSDWSPDHAARPVVRFSARPILRHASGAFSKPQGFSFQKGSATAHVDGPCRETSCPIQCAAHSSCPVSPGQVPHHGRSSFAPWAFGYFAAFNLRSRSRNLLHEGPLRDGLGAAYHVPRQASGFSNSEEAATAPRTDFGAPGPPSPQQASGLFFSEGSATAHDDGLGRETSRPIQCAAHSSCPVTPSQFRTTGG